LTRRRRRRKIPLNQIQMPGATKQEILDEQARILGKNGTSAERQALTTLALTGDSDTGPLGLDDAAQVIVQLTKLLKRKGLPPLREIL
jgi:hypothetical protein